jgi:hypothetical protein
MDTLLIVQPTILTIDPLAMMEWAPAVITEKRLGDRAASGDEFQR